MIKRSSNTHRIPLGFHRNMWRLRVLTALVAVLAALCVPATAHAQCEYWLPGLPSPGASDDIRALTAWDPDGPGGREPVLVAGGLFTSIGGTTAARVAYWDGVSWHAMGPGFNDFVYALFVYRGDLYAGGRFTRSGDSGSIQNIARWTGSEWVAVGGGVRGVFPSVSCMTEYHGDLVIGGNFNGTATSNTVNSIARWDGNEWHDFNAGVTWNGSAGYVYSLAVFGDQLIAGGRFTTAGGAPAASIAAWHDGTWQPLAARNVVYTICEYHNELYCAGGGDRPARWNGSDWEDIPLGEFQGGARAMTVLNDELILGGGFSVPGGPYGPHAILAWNGTSCRRLSAGVNTECYAACVFEGQLVVGGDFTMADGARVDFLARYDDERWRPIGEGLNGPVRVLASFGDDLIAGGSFVTAGGQIAPRLARWDGIQWNPMGNGVNGTVEALAQYGGRIIAGGSFSIGTDNSGPSLSQWDGEHWSTFAGGTNHIVYALLARDDDLFAGGDFVQVGGSVSAHFIARWDGAAWHTLGAGLDGIVYALAEYAGRVIVGGNILTAGGVPARHIAAWDGTAWAPLGEGLDGPVYTLAVYGGLLIAGGDFDHAGGVPCGNIAAWNGTVWAPLDMGISGPVGALEVYRGELIATGDFLNAGSAPAHLIAAWNGVSWRAIGSGLGSVNDTGTALCVHQDELVVGGTLQSAGGSVSPFVARCFSGDMPGILRQPQAAIACRDNLVVFDTITSGAQQFQWSRDGEDLADGTTPHGSLLEGARSARLTIIGAAAPDAGEYRCRVTGACGAVSTDPAALVVCAADFNCDASVSSQDFLDFVAAFFEGAMEADFNHDQRVDSRDFFDFLAAYFAGC